MIELTQKELMLIGQLNQKNAIFFNIIIFRSRFIFQPNVWNNVLMMSMNFSDIDILKSF